MKSPLLVILPRDCTDPEAALRAALEPFRLDDDSLESIQSHHWDYWYYPDAFIAQPDVAAEFPSISPELAGNLGRVERLSRTEPWSGVITPERKWHDIMDHGWCVTEQPRRDNRRAGAAWLEEYLFILDRYAGHLAAGLVVHR